MSKIFISHSSKDQKIVEELIRFLMAGMGVEKERIYCTSMSTLPSAGKNFMEEIKREMKNAAAFIIIFTENYIKSQMCLMEQGIAWYLSEEEGRTMYLMRAGITLEQMKGMPLRDTQCYGLFEKNGLFALYDGLCKQRIARQDTPAFLRHAEIFMKDQKPSAGAQKRIYPDSSGFYVARIREVRRVPYPYLCYCLDGLAEIPGAVYAPEETHWLFYREGKYPELSKGIMVRFKFEQTELRDFADLKRARNLYPTWLTIVSGEK